MRSISTGSSRWWQDITESILRNPGALVGLLRIKTKDDYTFLHSISVCALMVAFCRSRGLDAATTHQAGLGGLLHDTGKALVPDAILNKPGPLSPEEFALVKRHPRDGHAILLQTPEVGPIPLDITLHHHERRDGSGYPDGLAGDAIGELAQMAAIVDVYDALTSERSYHKAIPAADALRKIYEWSKFHFNPVFAQDFMRCVGIYPVGTMVKLESGRLAVVIEAHESNLLAPKVNVFFSTRSNAYIKPETVDLSRGLGFGGGDKIVGHESAAKWQVDPMRFFAGGNEVLLTPEKRQGKAHGRRKYDFGRYRSRRGWSACLFPPAHRSGRPGCGRGFSRSTAPGRRGRG